MVHDCLPRSLAHQALPRYKRSWNGDVWKSIIELRCDVNLDIITSKIDFGVGIIRKKKNKNFLDLYCKNFKKLKFSDYYYNHNNFLNIKSYEDTLKYLNLSK